MTRAALVLSLLALISLACQKPASEKATTPTTVPAAASESEAPAEPGPAVEYEPAYPTDVSGEELSEGDVAQQEAHSLGDGEEHAHAEEGHEHGEEEDPDGHQH